MKYETTLNTSFGLDGPSFSKNFAEEKTWMFIQSNEYKSSSIYLFVYHNSFVDIFVSIEEVFQRNQVLDVSAKQISLNKPYFSLHKGSKFL